MSRNGSGTYSIPNSFTASTTIESAKVNQNFSDIGSEITGSLPRNGEAAMTGQLKSSSGTAAEPGITFSSETSSGFYRSSAGVIGAAISGAAVATLESDGWNDTAGNPYTAIPSGTLMLFQQTSAPTGWTKQTTHNDKALRVVSGTASSGGTTAFSTIMAARTIARANLPNVTLTGTTDSGGVDHTHPITLQLISSGGGAGNQYDNDPGTPDTFNTGNASAYLHTHTFTTSSINGGVTQTTIDFAVQYVDLIIAAKN